MKFWICWILSVALTMPSPSFAKAPTNLADFFKQTLTSKKALTTGELVDQLLASWPESLREQWRPYFEGARNEKVPRIEVDGNRLLMNGPRGSVIIEFQDPEFQSVQVNGHRIWMQDLLQVHSGIRQIEKTLGAKSKAEFFLKSMLIDDAHAFISILAMIALAALLAGSGYIFSGLGMGGGGRGSSSGGASGIRTGNGSPNGTSGPVGGGASRPNQLAASPRIADANAGTRCSAYPAAVRQSGRNSICDVSLAVAKYGLKFDDSRRLFCGDQAWLANVTANDSRRAQKIDAKVSEIERQYATGLRDSLRSEYSSGGAQKSQDESYSRENFRKCVQLALQNELSGCNPNQPLEAVASDTGSTVTLQVCTTTKRRAETSSVNSDYYGPQLRLLSTVEGGGIPQPLNVCAVGRASQNSCDSTGASTLSSGPGSVPLSPPARR